MDRVGILDNTPPQAAGVLQVNPAAEAVYQDAKFPLNLPGMLKSATNTFGRILMANMSPAAARNLLRAYSNDIPPEPVGRALMEYSGLAEASRHGLLLAEQAEVTLWVLKMGPPIWDWSNYSMDFELMAAVKEYSDEELRCLDRNELQRRTDSKRDIVFSGNNLSLVDLGQGDYVEVYREAEVSDPAGNTFMAGEAGYERAVAFFSPENNLMWQVRLPHLAGVSTAYTFTDGKHYIACYEATRGDESYFLVALNKKGEKVDTKMLDNPAAEMEYYPHLFYFCQGLFVSASFHQVPRKAIEVECWIPGSKLTKMLKLEVTVELRLNGIELSDVRGSDKFILVVFFQAELDWGDLYIMIVELDFKEETLRQLKCFKIHDCAYKGNNRARTHIVQRYTIDQSQTFALSLGFTDTFDLSDHGQTVSKHRDIAVEESNFNHFLVGPQKTDQRRGELIPL